MNILNLGKEIFDIEINQVVKLKEKLDDNFVKVVNEILSCNGKIVISGIGKSGIIGKKIAATLMSTGTTTVFMNAAEAVHGDLGMINSNDIVIIISNSGSSQEIVNIIEPIKRIGAKIISFTGNIESELAKNSDIVLYTGVEVEACPLNIAPTASTTALLVMGDALAITIMRLRNFEAKDFAMYHPGGALGRKLLLKVKDVMISYGNLPIVDTESTMDKILAELTEKRLGAVLMIEKESPKKILGILTDGDLKRLLKNKDNFFSFKAKEIFTVNPVTVFEDDNAYEALEKMEDNKKKVTVLPVLNKDNDLVGLVNIHDLL